MVAAPGLIAILVMLACLAGLVILWLRVLHQPREGSRCGACGYAAEGLETMCCPECGGDLRQVGIIPPSVRRVRPVVFLAFWTLLLPLPALLLSTMAARLLPRQQSITHNLSVEPNSMSFPPLMLVLDYRGSTRASGLGLSGTSISSRGDGTRTVTTLNFPTITGGQVAIETADLRLAPTGGFRSIPPGTSASGLELSLPTRPGAPIDQAGMVDWLKAQTTTPDADEAMLTSDAEDLAGLVGSLIGGQPSYTTSRLIVSGSATSSGPARPPIWAIVLIVGFWTAVYAGGCLLFAAIRRRHAAESAPS